MALYKIRCRVNYHNYKLDTIDVFAVGVRDGIYNNPTLFPAPPMGLPLFDGLITDYVNKRGAYKSRTIPRAVFLVAKDSLMSGLDTMSVYVNTVANNDPLIIGQSGYIPTKGNNTPINPPVQPTGVTLKRALAGELEADCTVINNAESYGAALVANSPLPPEIMINPLGQIVVNDSNQLPPTPPTPDVENIKFILDLNKTRKKTFTGLQVGITYYVYYWAMNAGGVSPLSEPVSRKVVEM